MAKLYAELTSDKGGRVASKGGDEKITIKLSHGNMIVKELVFQIEKGTGGHNWELIQLK